MTEDQLTEHIRELARQFGILIFHVRDSRGSIGPGFPDLVLAGRGGTLFRELKGQRSRLSPSQWRWGEYLTFGGEDWKVWRAADWPHVIRAEMEAIGSPVRPGQPATHGTRAPAPGSGAVVPG